jgi:hypothetical protein
MKSAPGLAGCRTIYFLLFYIWIRDALDPREEKIITQTSKVLGMFIMPALLLTFTAS